MTHIDLNLQSLWMHYKMWLPCDNVAHISTRRMVMALQRSGYNCKGDLFYLSVVKIKSNISPVLWAQVCKVKTVSCMCVCWLFKNEECIVEKVPQVAQIMPKSVCCLGLHCEYGCANILKGILVLKGPSEFFYTLSYTYQSCGSTCEKSCVLQREPALKSEGSSLSCFSSLTWIYEVWWYRR